MLSNHADDIVQVDVVPMQRWDARVQLQRDVVQDELLLREDVDLGLDVIEVHDAQEDDVDEIVQVDVVPVQRWDVRAQLHPKAMLYKTNSFFAKM